MPEGMAVSRSLVFVIKNGSILLDWGDGRGVDLVRGEFIPFKEADYSHPVQDSELETLRRMGRVSGFDQRMVYITSVPDPPALGEG